MPFRLICNAKKTISSLSIWSVYAKILSTNRKSVPKLRDKI